MSLTLRACYTATCDICGARYLDPDTDAVALLADEAKAEQTLRTAGWSVLANGYLVCEQTDAAHQQIPGQLSLGAEELSR
ncbi:hypothetical protein [Streptomyces koyangensis]